MAKKDFNNEELFKKKDFDQLYLDNRRILNYFIPKYKMIDKEELLELYNIAFTKAINNFNLSMNVKFITFLFSCMRNEVSKLLKKIKKDQDNLTDKYIRYYDGNIVNVFDIIKSPSKPDKLAEDSYIKYLIEKLSRNKKDKIILTWLAEGFTQKEVSEKLSLTRGAIEMRLKTIKHKALLKNIEIRDNKNYMEKFI